LQGGRSPYEHKAYYAHSEPCSTPAPEARARRGEIAGGLIFLSFAIWATKSFMGKLSTEERLKVRFGVTRSTPEGREVFVSSSYATVSALVSLESARNDKLRDIATLPVTEVVEVTI